MEGLDNLIVDLALILISAGITTLVFKKIKQPVVLGYIVAGFLTGSNFHWFPTVVDLANIHIWANIGIIFLMFALGLEFSFQKLIKLGESVIITTLTVVTAMILIGFVIGELMGWSQMDSLFLGGMIALSSTMIILKAYEEYDLKKNKFADLVFGVLILEDLVGIFMMIVLSTLAVSRNVSGFAMIEHILFLMLYLVVWLTFGIYLIPTFMKKIGSLANEETLLIASLGLCLGMVIIATKIGFSSALGAFVAGSILAGTTMAEKIEAIVKPIKDLFGAIFFVSVGMMLIPEAILDNIKPIIVISITVVIGQMFFSGLGALFSGQSLHTAVRAGFSFVQVGEFSFIIATLGITLKVTSDFLYPVVVCVCVVTTFITPMMINHAEQAYHLINKLLPSKLIAFLDRYTSEKQSDTDKDEDWQIYLQQYFVRTIICTAALFVIYMVSSRWIIPWVYKWHHSITWEGLEILVIAILMSPFISIMFSGRKRSLFLKLWIKNPANRLPLVALNGLRVMIAVFFLMMTIRKVYPIPFGVLLIMAILVIAFAERSDFVKSGAISLETNIIANYNERILAKAKKERGIKGNHNWVDEKLYVVKFNVIQLPKKDAVKEFYAKRMFGIYIIKIIRGEEHINMPHATDRVMVGDTVFAMGTREQLEPYIEMLERLDHKSNMQGPPIMLRDFIYSQTFEAIDPKDQLLCCAIEIPKKSPLIRKRIKDSSFRSRYHGYIIGIERDMMPILNIQPNMVIKERDLIWTLGMQEMADRLLKDGLLM